MKLIFALTGSIKGERGEEKSGGEKAEEEREKERRFSGPALKLTVEFRFLYNRFNLIPALSRPFRRGCERRKNIYFRGIQPSQVTACSRYLPFTLSYTLLPPPRDPSPFSPRPPPFLLSFRCVPRTLFVRITAREVFLDTPEPVTDATGTRGYFNRHKNSWSSFIAVSTSPFSGDFFYAGIGPRVFRLMSRARVSRLSRAGISPAGCRALLLRGIRVLEA